MARPRQHIVTLTDEQVFEIEKMIRSTKTGKTRQTRLRILLLLDSAHVEAGKMLGYQALADKLGVCRNMVVGVVKSFAAGGVDKVLEIKRSPKSDTSRLKVDGRSEARLIEIACGTPPEGRARWTLRLLEDKAKVELEHPVSKDTIRRVLKKTNFDLTGTHTGASRRKSRRNS